MQRKLLYTYFVMGLIFCHQAEATRLSPLADLTKLEPQIDHEKYVAPFIKKISAKGHFLKLSFLQKKLKGRLYYGFFPYEKNSTPILFGQVGKIEHGRVTCDLTKLFKEKHHIKKAKGKPYRLFYRVINHKGKILFESKFNFKVSNKQINLLPSIVHGPFVNISNGHKVTVSYRTNIKTLTTLHVGKQQISDVKATKEHELTIANLKAGTNYNYSIELKDFTEGPFLIKTFPAEGMRKKFSFAFVSDSRNGYGGGEREYLGTNYYVMKRISAVSLSYKVPFMLFVGDMISGYAQQSSRMDLEYHNWKNSIGELWKTTPVFTAMGNHEVTFNTYKGKKRKGIRVPKTNLEESSEAIFGNHFTHPMNGPISEDNSWADQDAKHINFPTYKENVYSFTYDNVAIIVLNSNYWFAPSADKIEISGGNPHGYIMDNQLRWLRKKLNKYQKNSKIDHIFLSVHTPIFPNGGHAYNDMWYHGNNRIRPYAFGKKSKYGIIERRDQFLRLIDLHSKVVAVLAGDEHNYSLLNVTPAMPLYKKGYQGPRIKLRRKFWQITNGTAGAPYYAQETLPWSKSLEEFTSQNILSIFTIEKKNIYLKSVNPLTLEVYSTKKLK